MSEPPDDHQFSEGDGFGDPYEGFDIDPPELSVKPDEIDPVDDHVIPDLLDAGQISSGDIDLDQLLGVGLEYMGINRYEEAIDTFERVVHFADDESHTAQEALVNKGVAQAELEEWDEAIGAHRSALRIDEHGEHAAVAKTNLAYALWEYGQHDRALEHAERAVELDERLPQAWYNRGFFLLERGMAEDALFSLENAEKLGMRSEELFQEKAQALEELGKYDEAAEVKDQLDERRSAAEEAVFE